MKLGVGADVQLLVLLSMISVREKLDCQRHGSSLLRCHLVESLWSQRRKIKRIYRKS